MKKQSLFICFICLLSLGISGCVSFTPNNSIDNIKTEMENIYELYRANGGEMSYEEWLSSIKGEKGDVGEKGNQGEPGKSAYELYIEQYPGYTWGQEQWIEDLGLGNLAVTISFETFGGKALEPLVFCKGEQVTIDFEATKNRGTFSGWFLDDEFKIETSYSFVAENSLILYAKIIMDKLSVRYVSDESTYCYTENFYGDTITLPNDPTKIGYTFEGWFDNNNIEWTSDSINTSDDLVLFAKYGYDYKELPAVIIDVQNKEPITSKTEYLSSSITIKNTNEEWLMNDVSAGIRGRGNSSWVGPKGKQPYRIKFDKKQSLFGSSYKAKSWTLIANAADKSLLRNYIAYELGNEFDGIVFSPKHVLIDLYLNDEYRGVYLLCDHIQSGSGRVDIDESIAADGNNGYLIERDARAGEEGVLNTDYFLFEDEEYVLKTPDTESPEYLDNKENVINYISDYFADCLDVVRSGSWEDVANLMDIESFADSYIIDELFANNDCGFSSAYYYKEKDGKLFKGPIWDYDIGAGNVNYNMGNEVECLPDVALYASEANIWYKNLLEREEFSTLIKNKIISYENVIMQMLEEINVCSEFNFYNCHQQALERNFDRWDTMGTYVWPEPESVFVLNTIEDQIIYLHDWLYDRYCYLYLSYVGEEYNNSI